MATSRAPANQRQRTWRPQGPRPEQTARRRRVFRVLLPVLGVGLLGLLTWMLILWFLRPPKLDLIAIAVADYRNPEVPPIPYCYEDLEALQDLPGSGDSQGPSLLNEATGTGSGQIQKAIRETSHARDNLLVYVKAHGVSLNDEAVLLSGGFRLRGTAGGGPAGLIRVDELLEDVAASSARVKLLVLDTGHLDNDPRMGMLTNQFTHLVEKIVAGRPAEDNVWVITSNSLFERAQVSLADKRSAFGYFLEKGLRGEADGVVPQQEKDGLVQLNELYQYVHDNVSHYARITSSDRQSQTPMLFRAGEGVARQVPDDLILLRLQPTDEADEAVALDESPSPNLSASTPRPTATIALAGVGYQDAGSKKESGGTAASTQQPKDGKSGSASTDGAKTDSAATAAAGGDAEKTKGGAAPADTKGADAKTAPGKDDKSAAKETEKEAAKEKEKEATASPTSLPAPARSPLDAKLFGFETWLAGGYNRQGEWRPVDYAPDLVRLYYESLRGCRQRASAGDLFLKVSTYQDSLDNKLKELSVIQGRINDRGDLFTQGLARTTYETDPEISSAIRLRNDACFLVPLLIAHHSLTSESASQNAQELHTLVRSTFDLDRHLAADQTDPAQFEVWKKSLLESQKQVSEQLLKLQTDFQSQRQKQKESAGESKVPALARSLADLAQSPLASPAEREELRALAKGASVKLADVQKRPPRPNVDPRLRSELGWQRVLDRAALELDLVTFVTGERTDPRVNDLVESVKSAKGISETAPRLQLSGRIDKLLNRAYRDLPGIVKTQLQSPSYVQWRSTETAIRVADARDQARVDEVLGDRAERAWSHPVTGVPLAVLPKQDKPDTMALGEVSTSAGKPVLNLKLGVFDKVPLRFASGRTLPERLRLKFDFAESRVRLRVLGNELRAGATLALSSGAAGKYETQLEIASRDERDGQTDLQVTWVTDNGQELKAAAALRHPRTEFLQIAVHGQRSTIPAGREGESHFEVPSPQGLAYVLLRTFAGQETGFDFRVTNAASYAKKYTAAIYAIPKGESAGEGADRASALAAAAERQQPLARNDLTLEAGASESIPFYPQPAAPPAGAEKADPAKSAEAAKQNEPAKEQAPDVRWGLVCVLTEAPKPEAPAESAKPRTQRLVVEFKTIHPDRYIQPRIRYDAAGEVEARLVIPDVGLLPPAGSKVNLELLTAEPIAQPPSARLNSTLTSQRPDDILRSYVKPGAPGFAKAFLHVDGYPRAFIYDLPDASRASLERKRDLHEIMLPSKKIEIYYRETPDKPVEIPFAVDLPQPRDPSHFARLFIDSIPDGNSFTPSEDEILYPPTFDDREHQMLLVKPKTGRGMSVETKVSDLIALVNLKEKYADQEVHIRAQLVESESQGPGRILGPRDNLADKKLVLYLDKVPPTVNAQLSTGAIYENEKFRIDVDARDSISGVKQVLFDVKRVKNPDPKDPLEFVLAEPKPVPRLPNGAYQLAHAFEKAGDHALYFQVVDNSGNKNEPKEVPIEVQKVPMTDKGPAVPANQLGSIFGVAKVEGGRGNILRVTLNRGDKEIKGVDKPRDGQFAFEKLTPGDYELKVHGNYGGQTKVSKPSPVTVEPGKPVNAGVITLGP